MSWRRVDREKPPVGQKVRIWHPVLDEIHATMLPSGLWLFQHNGSLVDAPWIEWWMPCSGPPETITYASASREWYGPGFAPVSGDYHNVSLEDCEYR